MEEHFKNKLKNHKVDWDKEDLLPNLKNELAPNYKKTSWSWILLIPFLFVISYWASDRNTSASNDQLLSDTSVSKVEVDPSTVSNKTEESTVSSQINEGEEFTKVNINSASLSKIEKVIRIEKTKKPSLLIMGKTQKYYEDSNQIAQKINMNFNDLVAQQKQAEKINLYQKNNFEEKTESKVIEKTMPLKSYTVSDTVEFASSNISSMALPSSNTHIESERNFVLNTVPSNLLPLIDLQEFEMEEDFNVTPIIFLNSEDEIKIKPKKVFYVKALVEVGLVERERDFKTSNEGLLDKLEANEETERPQFALYTNLNFGYQHVSGLSVQSGLEYSEIREVFNYEESNIEIISKDTFSYIIIDLVGDTTFVQAPKNFLETTVRTVRHYNKHRFYSIPIQLAYQFDLKKVNLKTSLDISYTFAHSFEGRVNQVFSEEENIIIDDSVFELKNRFGLQVGLILEYPFLKDTRLVFSASYRRSPQLNFDVIDQRYNSMSLGVGVKFPLGGDD